MLIIEILLRAIGGSFRFSSQSPGLASCLQSEGGLLQCAAQLSHDEADLSLLVAGLSLLFSRFEFWKLVDIDKGHFRPGSLFACPLLC